MFFYNNTSPEVIKEIQEKVKEIKKGKGEYFNGLLIHGVRSYNINVLESILNNGVMCPEFRGRPEDGETFYHLDLWEPPVTDLEKFMRWLNTSNNVPPAMLKTLPSKRKGIQKGVIFYNTGSPDKKIGLLINAQENQRKEFINQKLNRYHKVIFVGVPSSRITGIITSQKNYENIYNLLQKKGINIPLYNLDGKIFRNL